MFFTFRLGVGGNQVGPQDGSDDLILHDGNISLILRVRNWQSWRMEAAEWTEQNTVFL